MIPKKGFKQSFFPSLPRMLVHVVIVVIILVIALAFQESFGAYVLSLLLAALVFIALRGLAHLAMFSFGVGRAIIKGYRENQGQVDRPDSTITRNREEDMQ